MIDHDKLVDGFWLLVIANAVLWLFVAGLAWRIDRLEKKMKRPGLNTGAEQ